MDSVSEGRLSVVCPALATVMRTMAEMLRPAADVHVVQGVRSWAEQAALWAVGRKTPGRPCWHDGLVRTLGTCAQHPHGLRVTNCPPGWSWHQFGLAVDLAPDDPEIPGWQPDWNPSHPQWQKMETVALSLGLTCGSQFRSFPDNPHFQLTGRFGVNPDDEVRQLFLDGGMIAVWRESGLWSG